MLATATTEPQTLAIGVDANAAAMTEASRRALRPLRRGGLPNTLFVVAAAESLPSELDGVGDALTVYFPWGSLLRGLLHADPVVLTGIRRVTRPGATVTVLLSVTERDRAVETGPLDAHIMADLAGRYVCQGLAPIEVRPADAADLARSHSRWAKRLGAGVGRAVWLARFRT